MSAVIPVFNQEKYLPDAIHSVLSQTFRDFELIVVDDGSTDRTPEVIASFGTRVRAFRKSNGGYASALNRAIVESSGQWIGWLSSDDLWEPSKLARQVDALKKKPNVGLVYTDVFLANQEGNITGRQSFPCPSTMNGRLLHLLRICFINGTSTLIRRDVFDEVGLYDEDDRLTADYDMWLRIVQRYDVLHVPEPLVRYRVHAGQMSNKQLMLERSSKRVVSRALRRVSQTMGALGAIGRFKDEVAHLPWLVKPEGGGFSIATRINELAYSMRVLVDPDVQ